MRGRETIKVRGVGTVRTIKFSVKLISGNVFTGEEDLSVWITDDDNRIPVLFEAPILVGVASGRITDWSGLKHPFSALMKTYPPGGSILFISSPLCRSAAISTVSIDCLYQSEIPSDQIVMALTISFIFSSLCLPVFQISLYDSFRNDLVDESAHPCLSDRLRKVMGKPF